MNQTAARAVRHYAQRENVAKGRAPTNSSAKLFNGEDYVKLQYRRIVADSVNDRQPTYDRVTAETPGQEVLGIQRPRAALKLDISAQRNEPEVVSALEENPYVIPLHRAQKA
jgi:predicted nucleotidyltransferase